jgi:hypothetical protein
METLVLLPGMDGTGDLFAPFVSQLGPDVQAVRNPFRWAGRLGSLAGLFPIKALPRSLLTFAFLGRFSSKALRSLFVRSLEQVTAVQTAVGTVRLATAAAPLGLTEATGPLADAAGIRS